jgi:hypothetical protein
MTFGPIATIIYLPNGHTYDAYEHPSVKEARWVIQKLRELDEADKQNKSSLAELDKWEKANASRAPTPESTEQNRQILLRGLDNLGRVERIQAELTGMLEMALQNCLHMTPEQINKIELNERVGVFKELVKISQMTQAQLASR